MPAARASRPSDVGDRDPARWPSVLREDWQSYPRTVMRAAQSTGMPTGPQSGLQGLTGDRGRRGGTASERQREGDEQREPLASVHPIYPPAGLWTPPTDQNTDDRPGRRLGQVDHRRQVVLARPGDPLRYLAAAGVRVREPCMTSGLCRGNRTSGRVPSGPGEARGRRGGALPRFAGSVTIAPSPV